MSKKKAWLKIRGQNGQIFTPLKNSGLIEKKLRSDPKKTQGFTKKTQVCESKTQVFDLNTKQGQDVKVYKKKPGYTYYLLPNQNAKTGGTIAAKSTNYTTAVLPESFCEKPPVFA